MIQLNLRFLLGLTGTILFSCFVCEAETKVPCLIFSGNTEKDLSIDLSSLNRITFGDNSMIISSSKDGSKESVELLYSLYHHIEIGDDFPANNVTSVDNISDDPANRFYVDPKSKLLYLQTTSNTNFQVGVFDINGNLLITSDLYNGDSVMLDALSPGVYIAVASDGETKLSLKFILN